MLVSWNLLLVLCTYVPMWLLVLKVLAYIHVHDYLYPANCSLMLHITVHIASTHIDVSLCRFHPNCYYNHCQPFKQCRGQWAILRCWSGMYVSWLQKWIDRAAAIIVEGYSPENYQNAMLAHLFSFNLCGLNPLARPTRRITRWFGGGPGPYSCSATSDVSWISLSHVTMP